MRLIGVSVYERTGAVRERVDHVSSDEHTGDRLIAASQALAERLDVGRHALLLPRVHRPRSAAPAHDLVQDQERAIPVTDVPHGPEISRDCRHASRGRTHYGLGAKSDDVLGSESAKLVVQLPSQPIHVLRVGLPRRPVVICEAGGDVTERGCQNRLVGCAPREVAAEGERAEGIAVIALSPCDEPSAAKLALLDEVLASKLEGTLHGLRAGRDEECV